MDRSDHEWLMKPTAAPPETFNSAHNCAAVLEGLVAACVNMHPFGQSLYTDAERKAMAAAAKHIRSMEQELNFALNRIADKDVEISRLTRELAAAHSNGECNSG